MLRIVFLGMSIQLLDQLKNCCNVSVIGAYLPPAPYKLCKHVYPIFPILPRCIKIKIKTAAAHFHLADYLKRHNVTPLQASRINSPSFLKIVKMLKPDLGIVANFGQILGNQLLNIPRHGFINFHPSLLPRYRGPNPLPEILLNGEKYSGVTWHRISEGIDQGDILSQEKFIINPKDTLKDLHHKTLVIAAKLLCNLLNEIEHGTVTRTPQNEDEATYCAKFTKEKKERLRSLGKY